MDNAHLGKSWISSDNPNMVTPFARGSSRAGSRSRSQSRAASRTSRRSAFEQRVFAAERLAYADGSVICSANICPKTESSAVDGSSRPVSPTGHEYAAAGSRYAEMYDAELAGATSDIDAFELRFPTIDPNDDEEREMRAVKARRAALQKLVPLLDTNMDGFIDRGEMRRAMPEARDEELTRVMKECDLDGDGKVEADEWVAYVLRTQQGCDEATFVEGVYNLCVLLEAPLKTAIEAAFTAADKDGSGKLDVFEASAVLGRKALDRGLKFQQVIDAFDVSGDGQIDFEEFERLFMMLVEIGLIERPRHAG